MVLLLIPQSKRDEIGMTEVLKKFIYTRISQVLCDWLIF